MTSSVLGCLTSPPLRKKKGLRTCGYRRRNTSSFLGDRSKKCGGLIEIFLPPLLKWMVMALGTFQSNSQKYLTEQDSPVSWAALVTIDGGWARLMIVSFKRQDGANEIVIWHVFSKTVPYPLIKHEHTLDPCSVRIGPE